MVAQLYMQNKLSIIVPVLNEASCLGKFLPFLKKNGEKAWEIIIVDGGSRDQSVQIAKESGFKVMQTSRPSRALQMNTGARAASGNILYFLHADTIPPFSFVDDILYAYGKGHLVGCFRLKLEITNKFVLLNNYISHYKSSFNGAGDQSLFIDKEVFFRQGGFNEDYVIMEDFELTNRLGEKFSIHIIKKEITASGRKYADNSYFKVTFANFVAFSMFRFGVKPVKIKSFYHNFLKEI